MPTESQVQIEHVRANFEHARGVHFVLVLAVGIILYLTLASWSSAPEVLASLRQLEKAITILREKSPNAIDSDWYARIQPSHAASLVNSLVARISAAADAYHFIMTADARQSAKDAFRVTSIAGQERLTGTIAQAYDGLVQLRILVEFIDHIDGDDLRKWMATHVDDSRTATVTGIDIVAWPELPTSKGSLRIHLSSANKSTSGVPPAALQGNIVVPFSVATAPAWSPDDFWTVFRTVSTWKHWDAILSMSFPDAIEWAATERASAIRDASHEIGGIKVQGGHLGLVGPAIILCLLTYLVVFTSNTLIAFSGLPPESYRSIQAVPVWLVVIDTAAARITSFASLVVAPFFAALLPVWRLTSAGLVVAAMLGGTAAYLGWQICSASARSMSTISQRARNEVAGNRDANAENLAL